MHIVINSVASERIQCTNALNALILTFVSGVLNSVHDCSRCPASSRGMSSENILETASVSLSGAPTVTYRLSQQHSSVPIFSNGHLRYCRKKDHVPKNHFPNKLSPDRTIVT